VASPGAAWELDGFIERLDAWAERENIDTDLRLVVTAWFFTRMDDPFKGARREPGIPNLWYAVVPDSQDGKGSMVVCSYWIEAAQNLVRCDNFGLLSTPIW
jgi:hypothetical protein